MSVISVNSLQCTIFWNIQTACILWTLQRWQNKDVFRLRANRLLWNMWKACYHKYLSFRKLNITSGHAGYTLSLQDWLSFTLSQNIKQILLCSDCGSRSDNYITSTKLTDIFFVEFNVDFMSLFPFSLNINLQDISIKSITLARHLVILLVLFLRRMIFEFIWMTCETTVSFFQHFIVCL